MNNHQAIASTVIQATTDNEITGMEAKVVEELMDRVATNAKQKSEPKTAPQSMIITVGYSERLPDSRPRIAPIQMETSTHCSSEISHETTAR
jgi:hypothetical protein